MNPDAKQTPRIIPFKAWAGCVHEPDRTFTEIIRWKSPTITIYDFLGIQRTSTSLTRREWDRLTQEIDSTLGPDNFIGIKRGWTIDIPGREQPFREICSSCFEPTDLYLLGKPSNENPRMEWGASLYFFHAFKSATPFQFEAMWLKNTYQIFIKLSQDGSHGPFPTLPLLAIGEQNSEILNLHFLRSPYGACALMNQHALPIDSFEDAFLLKQTFERLMGWQFLEKSNDRLEKLIMEGSTLQLGQVPPVPADVEVDVEENDNGWVFRGPLKISDGPHWVYEKIYHRCALRVNRDGTVHFQFLKELVEQYPGYQ